MNREWSQDHLREVKNKRQSVLLHHLWGCISSIVVKNKRLIIELCHKHSVRGIREKAQLEGASQCWWLDLIHPGHLTQLICTGSLIFPGAEVLFTQSVSQSQNHRFILFQLLMSAETSPFLFSLGIWKQAVSISAWVTLGQPSVLPTLTTNFSFTSCCPFLATPWAVLALCPLNLLLVV